ncbi:zinc finger CCCH domain-containing protein 11A-like isoform X2 [Ostrea edulis]|uniref:zinc finger CCCH domain-containing protein 11A-like isoform X2 n=1 Tax=Ostrea edulis TaxID=37623 RepID=UPI0024AF6BBC|nr:zinc finger CCCH domain-containing protein 11A-like isoform X2 [Ostrea edulis]
MILSGDSTILKTKKTGKTNTEKMSAFGNDCHFYYNGNCLKGNSCPFRHCEAAKANDLTCTYWKQKTCTKPNCPFKHSEGVLQLNQNKNRAEIPCYWETQPTGCTKAVCPFKHINPKSEINTPVEAETTETDSSSDVKVVEVHVQPVVVNLGEDSDVEMTSPVKTINKHRAAVLNKPAKQPTTNLSSETRQLVSQHVPKQAVKLVVNKPNIKSRLTNQMPEPENRKSVKDRLKIGVSDTSQRNSLKARLGINKPGIKNRLGITQQQADPGESTRNDSGEDSDLEVKSLEQIQREKALRSMGLIELKGGKIMKIADWEKEQREQNESSSSEEERGFEEDKGEEEGSEEEDEEVSGEESENDLEEPEEIELFAPDEPEDVEDTRTFISTGNVKVSSIPNSQNKNLPQLEGRRIGKRIVVDDTRPVDDKTPDLKASLKRRLGGRVAEVAHDSGQSVCEHPVKKKLTMPIGSSNQGTIKTLSGIKSRLGTVGNEPALLDARQKLKLKKMDNLEPIIMSVSMGTDEEDSNDSKGSLRKTAVVRKRGWRKTAKDTEVGPDKDSSRPVTPNQPLSAGSSPEKSTETEKVVSSGKRWKKEEDVGTKLQNMMTQKWRNNIWSNRNSQKSKPVGETLDSLGIGIIDIKGGKVVKMGKSKEEENTKMKSEDKLLDQIEKISRGSKKEIRERKVYVPPGRQRAGVSDPDAGRKKVITEYTEKAALSDEDSSDMQVKTFSEIMAAKRQRQKKLAVHKVAESNSKKPSEDLELPQETTEDSNEAPADVLKMAQMITGSLGSPVKLEESHHHRSKKKSKWRKKRKSSKEKKSFKENKLIDNEEESNQDMLKSCDTAFSEDSKNDTVESAQHSVETVDPVLMKAKRQNSENGGNISDKDILSPDKNRTEHLLSDSWLDLDEETEGGAVIQDDDDLLREIDELLA